MLAKQITREGKLPLTLDVSLGYRQELVSRVEDLKVGQNVIVRELVED